MFNFFRKSQKPISLPYSTDIHCHVIPGVDDGSPDVQTSADLIEHMQKWGISRIFASPHVTKSTFENTPETLAEPLRQLRAELASRGNDIEVNHHAEYRLDDFSLAQFSIFRSRVSLRCLPTLSATAIISNAATVIRLFTTPVRNFKSMCSASRKHMARSNVPWPAI